MCGIAGLMTKTGAPPNDGTLDLLEIALEHRGPDGAGRYTYSDTAILQTRLAIIDLNLGKQPFVQKRAGGGSVALVANGEIYNYRELHDQLGSNHFATSSDCEPPLHLYTRYGEEFPKHLRGMYAIAIYDSDQNCLILSRDPFGIKPLYYVETEALFAFASEPQALIKAGICSATDNAEAMHELLQLQFTCGRETPFGGIYRVLPGETLVIRAGKVIKRSYLPNLTPSSPDKYTVADAMVELERLFMESVNLHQRADVPYGMFLSGGIDSSALLAMMERLNSQPVYAFTVGFDGAETCDEREQARVVAKATGADHIEVPFNENDFWDLIPAAAQAVDDPTSDYAILPTYKLARAAHEANLKVILSGEGGDELFAGYGRYRRAARVQLFGGRKMRAVGQLDGLGLLRQSGDKWRYRHTIMEKEQSLRSHITKLQKAQALDCAFWLPNDLLTKLDRCLMAHSIEGRVPFLDGPLAKFALNLPDSLKVKRGQGKWLLRKWLATSLPESKPFSKKRGFTVPVDQWMTSRSAELGHLLARQPGIIRYCDPKAVQRLFKTSGKRPGQAKWTLLFFALWYRYYIEGKTDEGGTFEVLAA